MGTFWHKDCKCETQESWRLTLKGLAGPEWCAGFENYSVTVTWNSQSKQWQGAGCDSYVTRLECHPHEDRVRIWTAMVMAEVKTNEEEECICILDAEGDESTMHCLNGGTLGGTACSCMDESPSGNSRIVVTAA